MKYVSSRKMSHETTSGKYPSAVVGVLTALNVDGLPVVDYPDNPAGEALVARTTVALSENQIGCEVVLVFAGGNPDLPIIIGVMKSNTQSSDADDEHVMEGDRLIITAARELLIECGRSSIALTRAGKIIIRGEYVISRSRGVNRIQGASVQLN